MHSIKQCLSYLAMLKREFITAKYKYCFPPRAADCYLIALFFFGKVLNNCIISPMIEYVAVVTFLSVLCVVGVH